MADVPAVILRFSGEYRFLSNFYYCPVHYDGRVFPTAEHAYQYAKCIRHGDKLCIIGAESPGEAKRRGRSITLRPDWAQVKLGVMEEIVGSKFTNCLTLSRQLLDTNGAVLVEGNYWHDNYWGVCSCRKCLGYGQNNLGRILMSIRDRLQR